MSKSPSLEKTRGLPNCGVLATSSHLFPAVLRRPSDASGLCGADGFDAQMPLKYVETI